MDEFRSAQFNQAEKTRTSFNPSGVRRLDPSGGGNLSREYKKWAVNGRRVYWIAHKLGKCERGPVFTLDVERQEKCLDSSPYSMPEKDRWYDCIRLFKIEKDSIMNIPSLYEYKKSKRFGLSKVTQGVPINYEELVIDAYEKLELNKFNQVN